mgnify:CR=1 FL=1
MEVLIYSKNDCPNCQKAKSKLLKYNPTILMIGKDISREDFFLKFPNVKQVPQIVINNQHIGGYENLEKWITFNIKNDTE